MWKLIVEILKRQTSQGDLQQTKTKNGDITLQRNKVSRISENSINLQQCRNFSERRGSYAYFHARFRRLLLMLIATQNTCSFRDSSMF